MLKILLSILALIYALIPYDFIPDVLLGWGWLDDILILYFLWRTFYRGRQGLSNKKGGANTAHQAFRQQGGRQRQSAAADRPQKDPYTVLGVPSGASAAEIKAAYRRLSNQYHPDKVHHLGEEFRALAEERFKEIQEAYQQLMRR